MNDMFDNDDRKIKEALSEISVQLPDIERGVFAELKSAPPRRKISRLVSVCALAAVLFTGTAFALTYSSFMRLLGDLNPAFAEYLDSVEMSYEAQGIKMEVVAISCYGNQLKAYITLQDLTGNRINDNIVSHMDFISVAGAGSILSNQAHYNEETGVLTLYIEAENGEGFEGKEVTFKIKDIYNNQRAYENLDTGIDLATVSLTPETMVIEDKELLTYIGRNDANLESNTILAPGVMDVAIPEITSRKITNVGVVDGKLRLQIWHDYEYNGGYGGYYLYGPQGEKIDGYDVFSYNLDKDEGLVQWSNCYWEYQFDVDIENLKDYRLLADISESDKFAGEWAVTVVTRENQIKPIELECDLYLMNFNVKKIKITPFGVSMLGNDKSSPPLLGEPLKVTLAGETLTLSCNSSSWIATGTDEVYMFNYIVDNQEYNRAATWDSPTPIDIEAVYSLEFGGQTVSITNQPFSVTDNSD